MIDVTEDQIVTELTLANDLSKKFAEHHVRLAIDDFGKGHASLTKLKELPFAEMKLDRSFVVGCGTDKIHAPICKTVIDLAHSFGALAVGIGLEKASDAIGAGEHGLRSRPGLPVRPADAGGAFHRATQAARHGASGGGSACRRSRRGGPSDASAGLTTGPLLLDPFLDLR